MSVLSCALVLTACGNDDEASPDVGTAAPTTSNAPASPSPVMSPRPRDPKAIYVVSVETGTVTQIPLTSGDYFGPSWSPDGATIAFTSFANIWIANADGSSPRQLTNNGRINYLPAWSKDGRHLVFVSDTGTAGSEEIYRIDADGLNERPLTDDMAWDYRADWSPDGTTLMFGSERADGWQVFTMNPDGTAQAPLPTRAHGNAISWSRDGRIAFTSDRDGDDDIFVMRPDGSGQQNLTNNTAHDDNPDWSPDGRFITFSSDRSGKNEIFVMDADGSNVRQLTDDATLLPNIPTWSADGKTIAFSADATGP